MARQARGVADLGWSPWRTVVWFGLVSLAADMVYEGGRSIYGPFLASLGASALVVGIVTGAGEGLALALRLVAGPLADRTGAYWRLTFLGYAATAVCVPLLAVAPALGSAGLVVAVLLIWAERAAKALRSPAKSALLAEAAREVGRGKGIAVHKALDQLGAFAGPLVVAAIVAAWGSTRWGLAALALPGAVALVLLAITRSRSGLALASPRPGRSSGAASGAGGGAGRSPAVDRLPAAFYRFSAACAAITLGLMTFGVIGYHLADADLVPVAAVPLVYAGAMAAEAIAALVTGFVYDRVGGAVLLVLPILVAPLPALVFAPKLAIVLGGVAIWGAASGIADSTVKALVADLVARERLATSYGVFAAIQGGAALAGGALAGLLYAEHLAVLVAVVAGAQVVALLVLRRVLHPR